MSVDFNDTERRMLNAFVKHLPNVKHRGRENPFGLWTRSSMLNLSMHGNTLALACRCRALAKLLSGLSPLDALQ